MSLASVLVIKRERPQVFLEGLGQRERRRLAFLAVGVLQPIERQLDAQGFAADPETKSGDGLIILPVPGRIAGDRFFVEQLLDAILELIGLLFAHVLDPGPVMAERRVAHGGFERGIVDAVELEGEEQQVQRGGGDALLHVAIELRVHRIGAVAGIDQRGIGDQPAERVVEGLVALDRRGQRLAGALPGGKPRQPALEVGLERHALVGGVLQIPFELGAIETGIKVVEVPLRQRAQFGRPGGLLAGRGFSHGGEGLLAGPNWRSSRRWQADLTAH